MNIVELLKTSFTRLKDNPVILVPILAISVVLAILSLLLIGSMVPQMGPFQTDTAVSAEQAMGFAGMALGRFITLMIIGSIVGLLGHGMTVLMANDALAGNPVSLKDAWNRTSTRIVALVLTSLLVGILVSLGFILLVIPGIILAFFLMFTFVALMLNDSNPLQAVGRSFQVVKQNFASVFVFFLILIALGLLVSVVNMVIGLIPVLGSILAVIIGSVYATFVSVFVVAVFNQLTAHDGEAPEPEV
ncbi:MAG: hypothetical protein ACOCYB_01700 [Alkalispirochaeta sp.]